MNNIFLELELHITCISSCISPHYAPPHLSIPPIGINDEAEGQSVNWYDYA